MAEKRIELLNEGRKHAEITDAEKRAVHMAREAGVDIVEAVEDFIAQHGALARSLPIEDVIDEFLEMKASESKAEDRQIKNPLDEAEICAQRSDILSALWSITAAWDRAGRPLPRLKLPDGAKSSAAFSNRRASPLRAPALPPPYRATATPRT